jgi:hypothetical protein
LMPNGMIKTWFCLFAIARISGRLLLLLDIQRWLI